MVSFGVTLRSYLPRETPWPTAPSMGTGRCVLQVGDEDLLSWMQNMHENYSTIPKIAKLNLPGIMSKFETARTELQAMERATDSWAVPMNFSVIRTDMKEKIEAFRTQLDDMLSHKVCLDKVQDSRSTDAQAKIRQWRTARDKIRNYFKDRTDAWCVGWRADPPRAPRMPCPSLLSHHRCLKSLVGVTLGE